MVKIASIVWYKILPARFGGQKGIALFNTFLSRHIPLVCLCSKNNASTDVAPFPIIPELPTGKSQFVLPSCWKKIRETVEREKATHIILEHPYHGIAAIKAARATGARLIVHSHNIESSRFRRAGKWWWKLLFWYERWVHQKAALNFFKTDADLEWALKHFGLATGRCFVVPYGVEPGKISNREEARNKMQQLYGIPLHEKILLFAGTLDYAPNAKAVEDIYRKIGPILSEQMNNYRILICGRNRLKQYGYLSSLSHPSVIMAGEVDDIKLYFEAADVFINPVSSGGGVQTKNFDALAHHCNIVCFENMLEPGLRKVADKKIYSARSEDWYHFSQQVDAALIQREPTPREFFDLYDWDKIAGRVAGIIMAS